MTPPYTVVPQIVDKAAPGANTDILEEDFELPHEGIQEVTINIALAVAGKVNLVMKPGSTLTGVKATGTITCIGGADLLDGEEIVLDDGVNDPVTLEIDDDDSVTETDTLRQVVIAGTETAAEIAALITAAINGAPELAITATDNEDGTISLENDAFGSVGNVAITETVADTDFVVAGMSGGYGGDVTALLDINGAVNLAIDSLYSKSFKLQSGYLYNLQLTVDGIIRALSVSASK
jgi:hypothetical protein